MLMSANYRRIGQQGIRFGVLQCAEYGTPDARLGPAVEPLKHRVPVSEPLRQVAPRRSAASDLDDHIDEQPIVLAPASGIARTTAKQVVDSIPLLVRQLVAPHGRHPCQT